MSQNFHSLDFQVLSLGDLEEVYNFADSRLKVNISEENECRILSWSVKWRREALEHYLKLGWSFIARRAGQIEGFFLAQPLLFFRGQTQSLWIEHIEATDRTVMSTLLEVAIKVAREKHLQRVLYSETPELESVMLAANGGYSSAIISEAIMEVKSTKG